MGDFESLPDWLNALVARLTPQQIRTVNRSVATSLRKSQRLRIAAQREPDGTPFAPRKNLGRRGRVRRKAMFLKIRGVQHLKMRYGAESLEVGFTGRSAVVAARHQAGGQRTWRGRTIVTPARQLIGYSADDLEMILDLYIEHLAAFEHDS